MEQIQQLLFGIFRNSHLSYNHFTDRGQSATIRFVFCGILKIHKISMTFMKLYPEIEKSNELEFSLGILARSLLMDMILTFDIKKLVLEYDKSNYEEVKSKVEDCCYKLISDGTKNLLEEVELHNEFTEEQKAEIKTNFISVFPKAFKANSTKLNENFRTSIKQKFIDSKTDEIIENNEVYMLYSFYSKYDHLSHWTGRSASIPFKRRKEKIELSIILIGMHLRTLLSMGIDFDEDFKILSPYIADLTDCLDEFLVSEEQI